MLVRSAGVATLSQLHHWSAPLTRWVWDPLKEAANISKHGVSFALAERVFGDPWHMTRLDTYPFEERLQTIGQPGSGSPVLLLVVHTMPVPQPDGEDEGRIISARKADPRERRSYEEGEF